MFKRNLRLFITLALVLLLLSPLAQLLRTQSPWNCFQLTFDESYYLQAIYNWAHGNGFRIYEATKPFEPRLTVGLPLAWLATLIHNATKMDWPQAARFTVNLHFYAALLLIGYWFFRKTTKWAAPLIAISIIGYLVAKAPAGPYLIYGILGEMPGFFWLIVSLFFFDQKRFRFSGLAAFIAFFVKPSFMLFTPALLLAAFITERKRFLRLLLWSLGPILVFFSVAALSRHEGLIEYFRIYANQSTQIAGEGGALVFWRFFLNLGGTTILVSIAAFFLGFRALRQPSELASWLFFIIGILYFTVIGRAPQAKHFFVFYTGAMVLVTSSIIRLAISRISSETDSLVKVISITASIAWLINIPSLSARNFKNADIVGCPVKEQQHMNKILIDLQKAGKVTPENLQGLAEFSSTQFLYELGFSPSYASSWRDVKKPTPNWVVGDLVTLANWPAHCNPHWEGKYLGLLNCGR